MNPGRTQLNNETVLILGASGAAGIGAIKTLRKSMPGCRIISIDRSQYAAGFKLSDSHMVTSHLDDPINLSKLFDWMKSENVRLILPTAASDSRILSRHKEKLARDGIIFFGCDARVLEICDHKQSFRSMRQLRFPYLAK